MAGLINLLNINIFTFNNGLLTLQKQCSPCDVSFFYTANKREHVTIINGVLVPTHF